ncbi:MAG: BBP7 family outer membrane beta-barrel protein [Planctomycetia bacterium]|nr:BBP7 family outer membrane beta-barrel protein [Planctomycetia bacterium]
MKRFRVKAIGLSLALATGSAVAADRDLPLLGQKPGVVIPASVPALRLPLRSAPPASKENHDLIWLPLRQSVPAEILPAGGPSAPALPPPYGMQQPLGPRLANVSDGGTLPQIPLPPDAPTELPPAIPAAPQIYPAPAPRPVDPQSLPPMMPPPKRSDDPIPLPTPRPLNPQPELHPAPPELMLPIGAKEKKHGTFGSPPIRLSRDFPPVRDLIQHGHGHGHGDGYGHGELILTDDMADGPLDRFFVRGEYLLWWLPGYAIPILATTNANPNTNGFLGEPGTTALIGPGTFIGSTRSGFRIRAGAWITDCGSCGVDAGFFFLGNRSESLTISSDQFARITRPVFVPNQPPGESGESVAVPGSLTGSLMVRGDSRLWGADVNIRKCLFRECDARAEFFAGYRHLNLRESLTVTENILVIGPGGTQVTVPDPIGTSVIVQDSFATRNYFHGAQFGIAYERHWGRFDLDARASLALGNTHQVLEIDGFQVRQRPGVPPMRFTGGLLAVGPNLGRFTSDHFSVVPEFTLNVGYWVTPRLRMFAGYNFLFWSNVIRPGDQIDRTIDLTFVPNAPVVPPSGQNRPRPLFKQSDLSINGVQVGLEWRW